MEEISNVSSEEELLHLRNEGKISDEEYEGLLGVMKRTDRINTGAANQDQSVPAGISVLAVLSLVFSILAAIPTGFIWLFVIFFPIVVPLFFVPFFHIPGIIFGHLARRQIKKEPEIQGSRLAAAGLIIGYTVLGLSLVGFLCLTFVFGYLNYRLVDAGPPDAIEVTEIRRFALDNMEGLIAQSGVTIDKQISSDGSGSLRIEAAKLVTIRLFETGDINIENARLIYQAKARTDNVQGRVYLEMWCCFPGKGEFFSKGLENPLTGTNDWAAIETPFFLKKGQNPDNVKLNLVIDGKGTVWIDNIKLLKGPLE
jgi:hypothetical protein